MKLDNFSADYNESMYLEAASDKAIRTASSKRTKGGYINFRVVLEADEDMNTFLKFASKIKKSFAPD